MAPWFVKKTGKDVGQDEERGLIERSVQGEQRALEEIFARYRGRLYSLAYGMLQNREDALDVCQEAFLRAFRSLKGFRKEAQLSTWLYRIVVNLCIDRQRREAGKRVGQEEELEPRGTDAPVASRVDNPLEVLETRERRQRVVAAINELAVEQRAVIILREIEGLSYSEIAKIIRCLLGTVMSRLHYARKRLREILAPYQEGER